MVVSLKRLNRPIDAASLAAFRIAFGAAMVVLALRFFGHGWIEADYRAPKIFFSYWGLAWVRPWPWVGMDIHYGVMAASAGLISAGFLYRPACVVFAATFTYAHLCDKSNYLNHYYLVSWLSLLLVFLPLDREWSLRVWRRPAERRTVLRGWVLDLLRFQFAVVYVFGAIAKLESDWLVHGEPLRIWLAANVEMPVLGRLFDRPAVAIAFGWCGMLFDLLIVPLLSWRKTRRPAYAVAIVFHVLTAMLFKIGMFPWIMLIGATLFFEPSWLRRKALVPGAPFGPRASSLPLAMYGLVQVLVPIRHVLYPGNTLWTEEGFRYSWRIMLIEKSGVLELAVVDARGHRTQVDPATYLRPFQVRMAATQPDLILQLAHVVANDFAARGVGPVQVYADARVSFNGRPSAPLIDPRVDLAKEREGLGAKTWILPAPTSAPEF